MALLPRAHHRNPLLLVPRRRRRQAFLHQLAGQQRGNDGGLGGWLAPAAARAAAQLQVEEVGCGLLDPQVDDRGAQNGQGEDAC